MSEESRHLPLREGERQHVRRGREIQRGEASARMADMAVVAVPKPSTEQLVQEAARDRQVFYQVCIPLAAVEPGPIWWPPCSPGYWDR
jgi:hypothetical protein